jgi:hypothetical protein
MSFFEKHFKKIYDSLVSAVAILFLVLIASIFFEIPLNSARFWVEIIILYLLIDGFLIIEKIISKIIFALLLIAFMTYFITSTLGWNLQSSIYGGVIVSAMLSILDITFRN